MISDKSAMNVRSVSGLIHAPPDLIPHVTNGPVTMRDTWDAPVTMVRTRVSQSSPRLNVWRETEAWYRSRRQSGETQTANHSPAFVRGDQSEASHRQEMSAAQLKCFEVSLRRKLSERYGGPGDTRDRGGLGHAARRGLCKSVQTLDTREFYSPSDLSVRRTARPLSLDLGGGAVGGARIVPCGRVTVRACDEPYEEFRRAGIGACFRGEQYTADNQQLVLSPILCLHWQTQTRFAMAKWVRVSQ